MKKRLVIYGAGDTGASVAYKYDQGQILKDFSLEGFIDDNKKGTLLNHPILGTKEDLPSLREEGVDNILVSLLEDPKKRLEICLELEEMGFDFPNLLGNNVPNTLNLGKGIYIDDSVVFVGINQTIGDFCLIGPYSTIEGRTKIGKGNIFSPYCFVGYGAEIGDGNVFYPRSTVFPKIKIGDGCTLGHHHIQRKDLGNGKRKLRSIVL